MVSISLNPGMLLLTVVFVSDSVKSRKYKKHWAEAIHRGRFSLDYGFVSIADI